MGADRLITWRPKFKKRDIAHKDTILGYVRKHIANRWTLHAIEEHDWTDREDNAHIGVILYICAECEEYIALLKESEQWNNDSPEVIRYMEYLEE